MLLLRHMLSAVVKPAAVAQDAMLKKVLQKPLDGVKGLMHAMMHQSSRWTETEHLQARSGLRSKRDSNVMCLPGP